MVLHPPLLYMGFVALVVPFAYGLNRPDHQPYR
jgi:cytochrome c biogenesis factor